MSERRGDADAGDPRALGPSVVVVGSVNRDLVVTVERLPRAGETVLASRLRRASGGKGANQAVAACRAGGVRTLFVGAVGDDPDGAALRRELADAGVDTSHLATTPSATGLALITVEASGENTITVAAGANDDVRATDENRAAVAAAEVVLGQLEIPQDVLAELASHRRDGVPFLLNAAPALPLIPALAAQVDVLIVNEHEATTLAGCAALSDALGVLAGSFKAVLVTLGAEGAVLRRASAPELRVRPPRATAVDTVAAGDTFAGALAAAWASGRGDLEALRWASAAASLAVERPGAQETVPQRDDVAARMRQAYAS